MVAIVNYSRGLCLVAFGRKKQTEGRTTKKLNRASANGSVSKIQLMARPPYIYIYNSKKTAHDRAHIPTELTWESTKPLFSKKKTKIQNIN